ncbi:hypothetical protein [Methanosarcina barkeri]|uniref:hypothetical protein n=1 Tax=Methanosarcina barkeri TaxID=2208 RepID=UPI0006D28677|nr:hypothetical protein [Methanosarcina barkeri]
MVTIGFIIVAPLVGIHYSEESITRYAILTVMVIILIAIILLTGEAPGSEMLDKLKKKMINKEISAFISVKCPS